MKTAEEILKEITGVESVNDDANILCEVSEIKQAMRELAAQEVEAYKAKLRQAIVDTFDGIYVQDLDIIELIDTVK